MTYNCRTCILFVEVVADLRSPQRWHFAKVLLIRGGQGAIMKLAHCQQKAGLL